MKDEIMEAIRKGDWGYLKTDEEKRIEKEETEKARQRIEQERKEAREREEEQQEKKIEVLGALLELVEEQRRCEMKRNRYWGLGDGEVYLYEEGETGDKLIITRKVSKKLEQIIALIGINYVCFSIFGENGRDWHTPKRIEKILSCCEL